MAGLTFGIEICADHGSGILRQALEKTGEQIDIQIVLSSATVTWVHMVAYKNDQDLLVIHAAKEWDFNKNHLKDKGFAGTMLSQEHLTLGIDPKVSLYNNLDPSTLKFRRFSYLFSDYPYTKRKTNCYSESGQKKHFKEAVEKLHFYDENLKLYAPIIFDTANAQNNTQEKTIEAYQQTQLYL